MNNFLMVFLYDILQEEFIYYFLTCQAKSFRLEI
jgi:hypothetical protein